MTILWTRSSYHFKSRRLNRSSQIHDDETYATNNIVILIVIIDTSRDQWIKCFDFGELRMVAEGLQNKYQLRRKVGVNRPNTLRWLS